MLTSYIELSRAYIYNVLRDKTAAEMLCNESKLPFRHMHFANNGTLHMCGLQNIVAYNTLQQYTSLHDIHIIHKEFYTNLSAHNHFLTLYIITSSYQSTTSNITFHITRTMACTNTNTYTYNSTCKYTITSTLCYYNILHPVAQNKICSTLLAATLITCPLKANSQMVSARK